MRRVVLLVLLLLMARANAGEPTPAVLVIGDAVYQEPTSSISKTLKGVARVVFAKIPDGCACDSQYVLTHLDDLLGKTTWNLIYLNIGLEDLIYRAPGIASFRVMPKSAGGVRLTSAQQYGDNLQRIIKRLTATGAKVIWASTTPISPTRSDLFDPGSEIPFNEVAGKIMQDNHVPILDMHAHVSELLKANKDKRAVGDSPFSFGPISINEPVTALIVTELGLQQLPTQVSSPPKP